jgi:hypothetical protein
MAKKSNSQAVWAHNTALVARCGHNDALGALTGNVCGWCARRNHRKAVKGRR